MEYFLNRKYANLTAVLGKIFAFGNIETAELGANSEKYLGGVTIDEEGICRKENVIPETVKELAKEYYEQQNQKSNIIDFGEKKEFYKINRKNTRKYQNKSSTSRTRAQKKQINTNKNID